ncbi:MAG TPA: DUF6297 family protein [Kineosporiaceae bacterium]
MIARGGEPPQGDALAEDDALPPEDDDALAEDDALPPEDDASWAELTQETLRRLRHARAGHRRARLKEHAFTGYVATMAVLIYVVPYVVKALRAPDAPAGGGAPPATAPVIVSVVLAVLVALLRDGLWRGPVLLDQASTTWLLPLPLRREALLLPRLRSALLAAGVLGAGTGALTGVLLRLLTGGAAALLALVGAAVGATVLLTGVALGALIEAADARDRQAVRRAGPALWLLAALPLLLAGAPIEPARQVTDLLWTLWPALLAAAGVAGAASAVLACRRVTRITNATLRSRAAAVTAVTQSLGTFQPRRARLLIEAAQGRSPATRWRLPVPRTRGLLLPWRDATAVLRSPARLVWGTLWGAAPVPLLAAAGTASGSGRFVLAAAGLGAGYLATAQLAEGARLDADDPRAARSLPLGGSRLALGHLAVPVVGPAVVAVVVAAGLALAGPTTWPVWVALGTSLAALPALGGAALVSAFRGDVPVNLMVTGGSAASPTGDPGPVLVLLWYVRGPLAAVLLLLPAVLGAPTVPAAAVAGTVLIGWAVTRARRELG